MVRRNSHVDQSSQTVEDSKWQRGELVQLKVSVLGYLFTKQNVDGNIGRIKRLTPYTMYGRINMFITSTDIISMLYSLHKFSVGHATVRCCTRTGS